MGKYIKDTIQFINLSSVEYTACFLQYILVRSRGPRGLFFGLFKSLSVGVCDNNSEMGPKSRIVYQPEWYTLRGFVKVEMFLP